MQEKNVETAKTPNALAFKSALAYAIYFLILIYIFKAAGIDQNNPDSSVANKLVYSVASYLPFILAIIYVQTNYKKELGNYISFKTAFSAGFKVAAYAGLFIAVVLMFYYKVLDPAAYERLIESARTAAGGDTEKLRGVEMMKSYMVFFIGFGAAITYTIMGLITSLIGAVIIKNEVPVR
ncbi:MULTISPECIES: DUF4199 domain-containing protein [Pedobacter]|uniref:DUF4199 domain-containing protein n=1 Tax=Pedobacter heparinus (strain ATCC 13125 / DSM 2366 / CIP 104194 / JCM 7457 / NBRC 12017 / NCIMB 9290 / NRRL B-14731 / HIM 762-3) TaxID=485917 RepID=C6Y3F3_PEDHD|nr:MULTISPECIES: DUF4199 domain-containing protein [Pedobacter]ACU05378.1 hypothetical protein Phep_3183 [Pedobacter heparinus DSM 2366]MBB5439471.1 hypothetical protein [Pedobacter sp. AK017]